MCSGFFSYYPQKDVMSNKMKNRISDLTNLIYKSFILYFILNIFVCLKNGSLIQYCNGITKVDNILKFLFLNWTTPFVGVGHLWFIFALLYVYLIIRLIDGRWPIKKLYPISFIIIILVYGLEIINTTGLFNVSQIIYRNAFLFGFPFFILGHFLKYNINSLIMDRKRLLRTLLLLFVIWSVCFYLELGINSNDNCLFLSNIIFCIGLFILAVNISDIGFLSNLGELDSGNIYIIHYAFIVLINNFIEVSGTIKFLLPFLIFIFSYGSSILYRKLKFLISHKVFK